MPAVEIDEVELLRLRKQDQTVHSLMANPKAKKKILEAYKEQNPNASIPELEAEEAARKPLLELQENFTKLQKELADEKAEREKQAKLGSIGEQIERGKMRLREERWTDEGIAEVEKIMQEKGITDVEIAAAYYEKKHPPAVPVTPRGQGAWGFVEGVADDEKDLKSMLDARGQNEMLADQMARKVLNEVRGASARR